MAHLGMSKTKGVHERNLIETAHGLDCEGESKSEDLGYVDPNAKDLVIKKVILEPTLRFGKSFVIQNDINIYVSRCYFPMGVASAPGD